MHRLPEIMSCLCCNYIPFLFNYACPGVYSLLDDGDDAIAYSSENESEEAEFKSWVDQDDNNQYGSDKPKGILHMHHTVV